MTTYLSVRNWHKFQHYGDRKPIWIKLHVELLDDQEITQLPVATRLLWDQMLLLAARLDNAILNDPEEIARLTRMDPKLCREGVAQLLKGRWLRETRTPRRASKAASKALAKSSNGASPEGEKKKKRPGVVLEAKGLPESLKWQESDQPPDFNITPLLQTIDSRIANG